MHMQMKADLNKLKQLFISLFEECTNLKFFGNILQIAL